MLSLNAETMAMATALYQHIEPHNITFHHQHLKSIEQLKRHLESISHYHQTQMATEYPGGPNEAAVAVAIGDRMIVADWALVLR